MRSKKTMIGLLILSMVLIGGMVSGLYPETLNKMKVKPDLLFHKVNISRTAITVSKSHEVRIEVSARNQAIALNCSGPFIIRVERRGSVKRPWEMLGESGVAKLCYNPASLKTEIATRTFSDTVPAGKTHYYRMTLDPMGQVTESNENNNVMFKEYKAGPVINLPEDMHAQMNVEDRIPACDGIDLIIKNVEVIRSNSGNIFFKATIKNICAGSCSGPIIIEVDESEAMGYAGGVEQQIGSGIGGKEEYTMASALGVANRSDRVCYYNVSIRTEGGCIEPASKRGNNTFRVRVDPL